MRSRFSTPVLPAFVLTFLAFLAFLAFLTGIAAHASAVPALPPEAPGAPPAKPERAGKRDTGKREKRDQPAKGEKPDKAPAPAAGATVIDLGGKADAVRTGAGGRMLLFHLEGADHLTVVDVLAGKVVKQVPAPGDFHYAACRDKLLIALNNQHVIQRWDLGTLEREKTVLYPDDKPIRLVSMGPAGNGPLAVWPVGKVQFWDVATLKPLAVEGEVLDQSQGQLWPSADGRTFAAWGWSTVPYAVMQLSDVTATSADCRIVNTPEGEAYNESWAMPSADGSLLIGHGAQPYDLATPTVTRIEPGPLKGSTLLPTEDPRFLLALRRTDPYKSEGNTCAIVAATDLRVLYTINNVEPVTGGQIGTQEGRLGPEPRVHYLPAEGLLVTIPDDNGKVVVRPFDLKKALDSSGADYLFVISKPPEKVKAGDPYRYQIETLASAAPGALKYKLEDGPAGMKVSGTGLVTWDKAGPTEGGKVGVIVDVSDAAGQEVQHTIALNVERDVRKPGPAVAASATGVVELLPASAALHGAVKVEQEGNLGAWGPGDFVEWAFSPPAAGWYEVQLSQAATAGGAAYEVAVGDRKVAGAVEVTGHPQRYNTVTVGKLLLVPGNTTLSLKSAKANEALPMNVKWVRLTPTSAPPTTAAASPLLPVSAAERLVGVWVATPTMDEAKARAMLAATGVGDNEVNDAVADLKKKMQGLKIVYAFNKDGTAVGSYGTEAQPRAGKATWKVLRDTGRTARILITPESPAEPGRAEPGKAEPGKAEPGKAEPGKAGLGKTDEMDLTFFGRDRFTMRLPDADVPVRTPVLFTRSDEAPPKVDEKPKADEKRKDGEDDKVTR